jgi:intracellular sulfur oxidation DsrE/DsrF family protein
MTEGTFPIRSERRSFLTRLSAGVSALAATMAAGVSTTQGQSPAAPWRPERHEKDDWLDKLPGKHRMIFDTTNPAGLGDAIVYTNNFIRVNQTDYELPSKDLAVVIVVRHNSTAFAYNDAMWAKYGMPLALRMGFMDPKSNQAPKTNLYRATDYGVLLPNRGTTLDSILGQGVQLAVCQVATRGIAGAVAQATGQVTDNVYNELVANLVTNARMVPAGIVAVNRAQERGYSFVSS